MEFIIIFGGIVGIAIITALVASIATVTSVAAFKNLKDDDSEE